LPPQGITALIDFRAADFLWLKYYEVKSSSGAEIEVIVYQARWIRAPTATILTNFEAVLPTRI
jgi:hypothetical protein